MRPRVAALAGGAVLAVVLVAVLLQSGSRLAYVNGKPVQTPAVVPAGSSLCQVGEYLPPGGDIVRMWISTAGKPGSPVDLTLLRNGRAIGAGHVPAGYRDQAVTVPVTRPPGEQSGVTVCLRNRGPVKIGVMGGPPGPDEKPARAGSVAQPQVTRPGERAASGRNIAGPPTVVRLEWHLKGTRNWLSYAPTIARRDGLVKASFIGPWVLWATFGLALAAGAAGVAIVARDGSRGVTG